MTMISAIGHGTDAAMLSFFIAAEEADFHWEARLSERWLGAYESLDVYEDALDRIAILGRLEERWFVGIAIVDGNGAVQDLPYCERFEVEVEAVRRFHQLR